MVANSRSRPRPRGRRKCRLTGKFTSVRARWPRSTSTSTVEAEPALLAGSWTRWSTSCPRAPSCRGLELGGVPIATVLSARTGLPALFVRKQAKEYGTCKLAEGPDVRAGG